jgi:hypothetical protein
VHLRFPTENNGVVFVNKAIDRVFTIENVFDNGFEIIDRGSVGKERECVHIMEICKDFNSAPPLPSIIIIIKSLKVFLKKRN